MKSPVETPDHLHSLDNSSVFQKKKTKQKQKQKNTESIVYCLAPLPAAPSAPVTRPEHVRFSFSLVNSLPQIPFRTFTSESDLSSIVSQDCLDLSWLWINFLSWIRISKPLIFAFYTHLYHFSSSQMYFSWKLSIPVFLPLGFTICLFTKPGGSSPPGNPPTQLISGLSYWVKLTTKSRVSNPC